MRNIRRSYTIGGQSSTLNNFVLDFKYIAQNSNSDSKFFNLEFETTATEMRLGSKVERQLLHFLPL